MTQVLRSNMAFHSALNLGRAIQSGEIASEELARLFRARYDQFDGPGRINAIVKWNDRALADARKADEVLRERGPLSPLHGVPFTVKDTIETAGLVTTGGDVRFRNHLPTANAPVVQALIDSGAVLMGKTNTPWMATMPQTWNGVYGWSRNPRNFAYTAGGSSGGCGAAVAAGLSPLSVGSDVLGSIRGPSSIHGIWGLKPSAGRVPAIGHLGPRWFGARGITTYTEDLGMMSHGFLARDPADIKAALNIVSPRQSAPGKPISKLRIGYMLTHPQADVEPEFQDRLRATIDQLQALGATLVEGFPSDLKSPRWDWYMRGYMGEFTRIFGPSQPARLEVMAKYRKVWDDYFRDFDLFLMPVGIAGAFKHVERLISWNGIGVMFLVGGWTFYANLTGLPALSVPIGEVDGMPMGMQVLAPFNEDERALAFAQALVTAGISEFVPPGGTRSSPRAGSS